MYSSRGNLFTFLWRCCRSFRQGCLSFYRIWISNIWWGSRYVRNFSSWGRCCKLFDSSTKHWRI